MNSRECGHGKWKCFDGPRCIETKHVCDNKIHCTDGGDEKPEVCALWNCTTGMWKCNDDKCIERDQVCNDRYYSRDSKIYNDKLYEIANISNLVTNIE